ncbi:MAG TPA: bifunctional DNA-binding transcriptional regulator/O6-methylguanine-DNA methyltransferase Ada [Caulobacteraceae bacterium]|jgi:AraC family transcriptional regulator of adaptative response/methylated-DNA-[protein]-cysteine methyltransferase|nr:bifunctional DNA-binding transcriptional regulator/O6-methylguanine-DNA methyltransferase Ada [Caulobacteraceae bacterium]
MNAPAHTPATADRDALWAAVVARDPKADGRFFYSVRTTGVYCRPSCAARRANPGNVGFHATAEAAEAAGFRPCKRCKPDQPPLAAQHAALAARACRLIEAAETPPGLDALAQAVGMSPHHFHRVFKAVTGLTPRDYAAAHRAGKVREQLAAGGAVTEALYEAGFNSSSRFYEASGAMLGMTPGAYRAGGAQAEIRFAVAECSLGSILTAATDKGVCAIFLGDDPQALVNELQDRFPKARLTPGDAGFEETVARVVALVEAPALGLDLPLDVRGTAFQQRVWRALQAIPAGVTMTYADLAEAIGIPSAVRAVASACAANPLAVVVPCHRIVRRGGGLAGYRWGVERKRALIDREAGQAAKRA